MISHLFSMNKILFNTCDSLVKVIHQHFIYSVISLCYNAINQVQEVGATMHDFGAVAWKILRGHENSKSRC